MITVKNILVATDFGDTSAAALAYGRELARLSGATLHLLYVVDDISARAATAFGVTYDLTRIQTELEAAGRSQLEASVTDEDRRELHIQLVQLTSASPAATIVSYARDAHIDLIVMGTHGRGAVAHLFLGSVAERVVRAAPCPVLTVHHPEHEFIQPDALQVKAGA